MLTIHWRNVSLKSFKKEGKCKIIPKGVAAEFILVQLPSLVLLYVFLQCTSLEKHHLLLWYCTYVKVIDQIKYV